MAERAASAATSAASVTVAARTEGAVEPVGPDVVLWAETVEVAATAEEAPRVGLWGVADAGEEVVMAVMASAAVAVGVAALAAALAAAGRAREAEETAAAERAPGARRRQRTDRKRSRP